MLSFHLFGNILSAFLIGCSAEQGDSTQSKDRKDTRGVNGSPTDFQNFVSEQVSISKPAPKEENTVQKNAATQQNYTQAASPVEAAPTKLPETVFASPSTDQALEPIPSVAGPSNIWQSPEPISYLFMPSDASKGPELVCQPLVIGGRQRPTIECLLDSAPLALNQFSWKFQVTSCENIRLKGNVTGCEVAECLKAVPGTRIFFSDFSSESLEKCVQKDTYIVLTVTEKSSGSSVDSVAKLARRIEDNSESYPSER